MNVLRDISQDPPETLLIVLSGHGYQSGDRSRDEKDGRDEYIRVRNKIIIDDDLFKSLNRFDHRTNIIAITDTCHSGTMFDFPSTLLSTEGDLRWDNTSSANLNCQSSPSSFKNLITL